MPFSTLHFITFQSIPSLAVYFSRLSLDKKLGLDFFLVSSTRFFKLEEKKHHLHELLPI